MFFSTQPPGASQKTLPTHGFAGCDVCFTTKSGCWLRICRFRPAAWTSYGRGRGSTPVLDVAQQNG